MQVFITVQEVTDGGATGTGRACDDNEQPAFTATEVEFAE